VAHGHILSKRASLGVRWIKVYPCELQFSILLSIIVYNFYFRISDLLSFVGFTSDGNYQLAEGNFRSYKHTDVARAF
jgi:hypothetical protein